MLDAIRETWASIWLFRTFEERSYSSIDHKSVVMALDALHQRFSPAYGPQAGNSGWYAMDVEFKFDGEPGQTPVLTIKQARPHPGREQ